MTYLHQPATIIDRFCAAGKTTSMIENLSPQSKYLIVVPYLTEVTRVIEGAAKQGIDIYEPLKDEEGLTKRDSLIAHVEAGHNITTTHAMYPRLSEAAMSGLFKDYEVIIDEVVETVKPLNNTPSKGKWEKMIVGDGYVSLDEATGQVTPTPKWDDCYEDIKDGIAVEIYQAAKSGTLYVHNNTALVWALPKQLLTAGKALTCLTSAPVGHI